MNTGDNWLVRSNWTSLRRIKGQPELIAALKSWHPYRGTVIAPAENGASFRSPLLYRSLRADLLRRARRRAAVMAVFLSAVAALAFLILPASLGRDGLVLCLILVLFATAHVCDWRMMRSPRAATESAVLIAWLAQHADRRRWTWFVGAFCVALGLAQIVCEALAGGQTQLLLASGIVLAALSDGDYWRLLIGFFWHASFVHWLQNAIAITLLAPAALVVLGHAWTWTAFAIGLLAGVVLLPWVTPGAEAVVGISGGVHAIAALVLVTIGFAPQRWPAGPIVTLACLVGVDYLLTFFVGAGSLALHGAGTATGAALGFVLAATLRAKTPPRGRPLTDRILRLTQPPRMATVPS